jgi:hypothetical protein
MTVATEAECSKEQMKRDRMNDISSKVKEKLQNPIKL